MKTQKIITNGKLCRTLTGLTPEKFQDKNGHGRTPTLVASYLIRKGKNPEEAEEFIKSKRPSTHLEEAQQFALRNFNDKT